MRRAGGGRKPAIEAQPGTTLPGRYYIPFADIHETDRALRVARDPSRPRDRCFTRGRRHGGEKKDLDVALENGVLRVGGHKTFAKYGGLEPLYTEYSVGH